MVRVIYAVACLLAAGLAGALYYGHTREAPVVVATRDLKVGSRIGEQDVAVRSIPISAAPDEAIGRTDQVVGQFVAYPVLSGEFLSARQISRARTGNALANGLPVPPGDRVLSLPVTPSSAVGGALSVGDLVDVIAIPNESKGTTSVALDAAGNTVLGQRVLVLGLRTDQGTVLEPDLRPADLGTAKLGSVLLAIPEGDEQRYAEAVANDTFVLALVTD